MSNTNTIPDTQNTIQDQENEELLVVFNNEDVKEGLQGCENSLIKRLLTEKASTAHGYNLQCRIFGKKLEGLRIVELKHKTYQFFFFQKEIDLDRVLKESPWFFRNSWFLLKKWDRSEDPVEKGLDKADIKVQIWNLLEHCKTARDQVHFIKAIATLNTTKPILKGANIGSKEDSNCQQAIKDEEKRENKSKDLGSWLKASLKENIVKVVKNQQNENLEERKEKNAISQQRLTARMLEKLEKLTMKDRPESSNSKEKKAEQLQYKPEQRARIEQEGTEEIPLTLVKQNNKILLMMAIESLPEKVEQKESTENIEEEASRKETKKKERERVDSNSLGRGH
ncbi:hypothetical protein Ahy_A05g023494 [Arachis hypogaea]|uniref:DUF4283 domain-containing protein n=1 Tax=Arachis hypogaea TaxID=3818 RepID=A0A445D3J9_ARAHY|nr:hypothetical protein Ahy_A05g023494 [Arachis hypogaea]